MFYFLYGNTFPLPSVCVSFPQNSGFSATELPEAAQNSLILMLCSFHRALQDLCTYGYVCVTCAYACQRT